MVNQSRSNFSPRQGVALEGLFQWQTISFADAR